MDDIAIVRLQQRGDAASPCQLSPPVTPGMSQLTETGRLDMRFTVFGRYRPVWVQRDISRFLWKMSHFLKKGGISGCLWRSGRHVMLPWMDFRRDLDRRISYASRVLHERIVSFNLG